MRFQGLYDIRIFVSYKRYWTLIITQWILAHFGWVRIRFKRLYSTTRVVTGTTVPAACYRSFWFGIGTSNDRNRNIALRKGYVTETSPKFRTPLLRFIRHGWIHKFRAKTRYNRPVNVTPEQHHVIIIITTWSRSVATFYKLFMCCSVPRRGLI